MEKLTEPAIRELLKMVYDPELGVDIIELGLVYDISIMDDQVSVRMTLTTPGCPMHDTIIGGVHRVLQGKEGVSSVNVDVVWEPRWSPELMSDAAKEQLNFF